jgi:hypothetical protein
MENLITKVKHKVNDYFPLLSADPPNSSVILAKADSGASSHYFKPSDRTVLSALRSTPFGPTVMLPDSTNMQATHSGQLPLHSSLVPATAKTAHILDGMTNSSLISIGQLCDDDCVEVLDKQKVQVFKRDACVLSGTRNKIYGLWDIALLPISRPASTRPRAPLQLNAIIRKDISKINLAQHLHGCLGSPDVSTWKLAIANGNFITWPGINTLSIDAHLPKNIASAKGHMDQERKNLRSTRIKLETDKIEIEDHDDAFFPIADTPNAKTFAACAQIVPFVVKNTACHDLTGRFPHRSSRGDEHLLLVYDHDSNSILHAGLKNKTAAEIKRGWISIHERLMRGGKQPKVHILDNEASADLEKGLKKHGLDCQPAPPHVHRRNAAERAARTFKSHLLAFLATCDPDFPVAEWDRLLFQAELTLNLLRSSRVNPRLSAHAYLFGNFDFNETPLAPPGTKVVVHLKPDQRASWVLEMIFQTETLNGPNGPITLNGMMMVRLSRRKKTASSAMEKTASSAMPT